MNQIGVIGLGTMGANLARNAARHVEKVVLFNRTKEKTNAFINAFADEGGFVPVTSYEELVHSMTSPRVVLLMVKAGDAVDTVLNELTPLLEQGDIIIDGGNSYYKDTQRRYDELKTQGIHFIGMGISGGEEGALHGPSMMPGAEKKAYTTLQDVFKKMSANDGDGGKCVAFLGEGGVGHFVKMVHNGIEYAVMQIIAEAYHILKMLGSYSNEKLSDTFSSWNTTEELESFLIEITAHIFQKKEQGKHLIDYIRDTAKQKGTGKWTSQAALDYGVAVPTITAGVDARIISGSSDLRERAKNIPLLLDETEPVPQPEKLRSFVKSAVELSILCAYQQGFDLIKAASDEYHWNVNISECARIWRGGCIIRSAQLKKWQAVYSNHKNDAQAALEEIRQRFNGERQQEWRMLLEYSISRGIPTPAISASLHYFDALHQSKLPQNLIQAQRDYFGAHTYERIDKKGTFHTAWGDSQ